jgi:PAS domain S-box-containing protein
MDGSRRGGAAGSVDVNPQEAGAGGASEAWYRLLLEEQGDITSVIALDGTVRYSSPAVTRVLGYPSEGRRGFSLFDLVHPDDVAAVRAHVEALARRPGARMSLTGRYRHADGSYRWMDTTGRRVELPDGAPALILTSRDVTEREEATQALAESRRFIERILQAIPDVVYTFDLAERRMTFVTASCAQVVGVTAEELIAMGARIWPELVHPDDLAALAAFADAWREFRDPAVREIEYRLRDRRGGWRRIVQRSLVLSRGADGRPITTLGVMQDVTEQRRTEARLRQAERMEALGRLAGGIAHDFNNLLAVILHALELQEAATPAGPLAEANADALAAARRARDLVRGILTFSRMHEPTRAPFALADVVREALRFFGASKPAALAVEVALPDEPCHVLGDAAQVQQVLLNLCANAAYATRGTPGAVLRVALERRLLAGEEAATAGLAPGAWARLAVQDNGIGMTDEVARRAFEPFFTTKPQGEGTGLGLAIAHGVVHAHGGTLLLQSAPGSGTGVEVWLPLAEAGGAGHDPRPVVPHAGTGRGGASTAAPPGLSVLLVDDEPAVRRTLGRLLEAMGHRVTAVADPREALALLRDGALPVDVVLTDQTMPVLSGDALAREIRALRPTLPVILCSGYSDRYQAGDAERDGLLGFLGKPIDREALVALLAKVSPARAG